MNLQTVLPDIENLVHPTRDEIQQAVLNPEWQNFRAGLKGLPTGIKLVCLRGWLIRHAQSREATIQVKNYVNALKRGGQITLAGEITFPHSNV
jgi:hypothetical protein